MANTPALPRHAALNGWGISLAHPQLERFPSSDQSLFSVDGFLETPEKVISVASLQSFAKITPQYPGVRSPLDEAVCRAWLGQLSPMLDQWFGEGDGAAPRPWAMQAWYSLVTTAPADLAPIQRLPHIDGTDPDTIAMMLYLHRGAPHANHGGTAFFRHRSTGFDSLTAETYPRYAAALRAEVARAGLPSAAYPTDGAPHFDRVHVAEGRFNRAVFYRGNILHSGVIDNAAPLLPSPAEGRLTINAFFRPVAG